MSASSRPHHQRQPAVAPLGREGDEQQQQQQQSIHFSDRAVLGENDPEHQILVPTSPAQMTTSRTQSERLRLLTERQSDVPALAPPSSPGGVLSAGPEMSTREQLNENTFVLEGEQQQLLQSQRHHLEQEQQEEGLGFLHDNDVGEGRGVPKGDEDDSVNFGLILGYREVVDVRKAKQLAQRERERARAQMKMGAEDVAARRGGDYMEEKDGGAPARPPGIEQEQKYGSRATSHSEIGSLMSLRRRTRSKITSTQSQKISTRPKRCVCMGKRTKKSRPVCVMLLLSIFGGACLVSLAGWLLYEEFFAGKESPAVCGARVRDQWCKNLPSLKYDPTDPTERPWFDHWAGIDLMQTGPKRFGLTSKRGTPAGGLWSKPNKATRTAKGSWVCKKSTNLEGRAFGDQLPLWNTPGLTDHVNLAVDLFCGADAYVDIDGTQPVFKYQNLTREEKHAEQKRIAGQVLHDTCCRETQETFCIERMQPQAGRDEACRDVRAMRFFWKNSNGEYKQTAGSQGGSTNTDKGKSKGIQLQSSRGVSKAWFCQDFKNSPGTWLPGQPQCLVEDLNLEAARASVQAACSTHYPIPTTISAYCSLSA
ncbi:unnamed protein product [Amoebophrya sp. A120]|nr:unnamed protein product [Amoebophrya sp. A120]|eukprot:GSA120T00012407001.1